MIYGTFHTFSGIDPFVYCTTSCRRLNRYAVNFALSSQYACTWPAAFTQQVVYRRRTLGFASTHTASTALPPRKTRTKVCTRGDRALLALSSQQCQHLRLLHSVPTTPNLCSCASVALHRLPPPSSSYFLIRGKPAKGESLRARRRAGDHVRPWSSGTPPACRLLIPSPLTRHSSSDGGKTTCKEAVHHRQWLLSYAADLSHLTNPPRYSRFSVISSSPDVKAIRTKYLHDLGLTFRINRIHSTRISHAIWN